MSYQGIKVLEGGNVDDDSFGLSESELVLPKPLASVVPRPRKPPNEEGGGVKVEKCAAVSWMKSI
ncbi:hypothetical protein SESBI_09388 [Sesbania bispinosa]|nr:hypothetical protein SESBI_09388 [Sesbania bispinosa]